MDIKYLVNNLRNNGYSVSVFESIEEANTYFENTLVNKTIGIGGSVTVDQMGLYDVLKKNNEVYGVFNKDDAKKAMNTDVYFSSVNGISLKGEIVNIDGTGNRVASTLYGHKKVIFVFGINKIAADLDSAIYRARNIAAVRNAIRLNKNTPCTKTNKCMDCDVPDRICRGLSIFMKKPKGSEYEVVIIKQELGY